MKLINPSPRYSKIDNAIVTVAQNMIRGFSNTSPFAVALANVANTTFIPDAPPDDFVSNIDSFSIMLRSGTLRNGVKVSVPPSIIADVVKIFANSWWNIGNRRWKVSKISKKRKIFSLGKVEHGIVSTSMYTLNGTKYYHHHVYTNVNAIKISEWNSFLNTYIDGNSVLHSGQTYRFENDIVTLMSHSSPILGVTKVSTSGLLYLDYGSSKLPLIYDRKHAKLSKVMVNIDDDNIADRCDLEVYCSYANKMYNDHKMIDFKGRQFTIEEAEMIFASYGGSDLRRSLESDVMSPDMPDTMLSEYYIAWKRMHNWLTSLDSTEDNKFQSESTFPRFEYDEHTEAVISISDQEEEDEEYDVTAEGDGFFERMTDFFAHGYNPDDFDIEFS